MDSTRLQAMRRVSSRLLLLVVLLSAGCAGQPAGTLGLQVSEDIGTAQDEGTLIVMEVITPLTREQALQRFRPSDLQAAGLNEAEIRYGTAVFASPWHQRSSALFPARGVFALVKPDLASPLNSGASTCGSRGCSYGGDAVAIRIVRKSSEGTSSGLYVVDAVVEPRSVQGDCAYTGVDGHRALYCKSLEAAGWEWKDALFIKRPTPSAPQR